MWQNKKYAGFVTKVENEECFPIIIRLWAPMSCIYNMLAYMCEAHLQKSHVHDQKAHK